MNVDKIKGFLPQCNIDTLPIKRIYLRPIMSPPDEPKTEWQIYRSEVRELTEQVSHLIPGVEMRGFTAHHIDHIISIWKGFKLGIEPHKIADLANLRMLPYKENLKKGVR